MNQQTFQSQPPLDEAGLVTYLHTQSEIAAAYLFGSYAQGRAHPRSDVDIAVLVDETQLPESQSVFDHRLRLMTELARFGDGEIDVVTLNDAPLLLCHQVLLHGRLLYEGNREMRIDFEVRTGKLYDDFMSMSQFFEGALRRELEGAGFGGYR